jgi:hypothetical protein
MTDYGLDVSTYPDGLDVSFAWQASSVGMLGQALARRLETPAGGLPYDPEYGFDVRALLGDGFNARNIPAISALVAAELAKDERVADVEVESTSIQAFGQSYRLALRVIVLPIEGESFSLTLSIDNVSADLLAASVS